MPRDITTRCVPARRCPPAASNPGDTTSLAARVTELEYDVSVLENRVTALEGVQESGFTIVDTEAEFDAALLTGKHILLRGEGNGGEISLSGQKNIVVPGTKIWGYGYTQNSTEHFSKIKLDGPLNLIGGLHNYGLHIEVDNVEMAGFEIQGRDALDTVYANYFAIVFDPSVSILNPHLHDLKITKVHQGVSKQVGAGTLYNPTIERLVIESIDGSAIAMQQNITRPVIQNCRITPKLASDSIAFANRQGITLTANVVDALIQGNVIQSMERMGIEMTSTEISAGVFQPMLRNKVINNTIKDTGSIGISFVFPKGGHIEGNTVENATYFGIENGAGSILSQSNNSAVEYYSTIANNTVNGVTASLYPTGIISDKTVGDIVTGNTVKDIYSGNADPLITRGISAFDARRTFIASNTIVGVDGSSVFLQTSLNNPALAGYIAQGNVMRALSTNVNARWGVVVLNSRAMVQGNKSFAPTAGLIKQQYVVNNNPPVAVNPGFAWTSEVITGLFNESNLEFLE